MINMISSPSFSEASVNIAGIVANSFILTELVDTCFCVLYEGRSICYENSPVYPKILYLHTS